MDDDDGQGVLTVGLPVTVAENPYSGFNFHQPRLASGQCNPPPQEEAGDGLHMPTLQKTPGNEFFGCGL